jgi:hypothetical protein
MDKVAHTILRPGLVGMTLNVIYNILGFPLWTSYYVLDFVEMLGSIYEISGLFGLITVSLLTINGVSFFLLHQRL